MKRIRSQGEKVRKSILEKLGKGASTDIVQVISEQFSISRQAAHKHIARLISEGSVESTGGTRNKRYKLRPLEEWKKSYALNGKLQEHVVWNRDISPVIGKMAQNVLDIWQYGLTEMLNNAIDHSNGSKVDIKVSKTAAKTDIVLWDNGVGIFKKIKEHLGLFDERHAVLELAKGKLTTDPKNHSGEGVFFSSRMFDEFYILSGETIFAHRFLEREDWIIETKQNKGTIVYMTLSNHTSRTTKKIFDAHTSKDTYQFNKTVVPVRLAQFGSDKLVSRSQAKRLLDRIDRFKVVILDFSGVEEIGQGFADEIFRVFANRNPKIEIHTMNTNSAVKRMMMHVQTTS